MLALPLFLVLLSLLGWFLFISRSNSNRILITIIGVVSLFVIDIILPFIIWPNRNPSNCDTIHIVSSVYILIITYKLFEIISFPLQFFKRHNITKGWQIFVCLVTPSQINFIDHDNSNNININTRKESIPQLIQIFLIIPLISFICTNIIIYYKLFESSYTIYWQYLFYCIWILSFVSMQLLNCLSCIIGLIFGNKIKIKYSYKWPLFNSRSPRSLWKNWSCVVGESLRYLIYEPLGGRNNLLISTSTLFLFNCLMHIYWSWLQHKQFAVMINFKIFTILCASVYSQILAEHFISKEIQNSILWKIFWLIVLYVSVISVVIIGFGTFFVPFWNDLFSIYGIF